MGGMASATLTCPLDVLRTRLQSDFYRKQLHITSDNAFATAPNKLISFSRSAASHVLETLHILRSIHVHEGWNGLLKGLGPNLIGVVPSRAINFYVYGNGKRIINDYFGYDLASSPVAVHLFSAAIAGIATSTATNPIWVVKTRLQLDRNRSPQHERNHWRYRNGWHCTVETIRHEGLRGLYRGLSASYLGVTESTFHWVMYEQMKRRLAVWESQRLLDSGGPHRVDIALAWAGKIGAAGSAKLLAAAVTYPHEVVRTRLRQTPTINVEGRMEVKYRGLLQCFTTIWSEEGIIGFYGGLTPHLLRVVPSAAIMFGV
ncbi:hypothetical protein KEM55_000963 [Ascosphaera atra]|nr:hypothetical protein KEM55_000963 [Ascosphaera atra]